MSLTRQALKRESQVSDGSLPLCHVSRNLLSVVVWFHRAFE
jgi:hypothetical protein